MKELKLLKYATIVFMVFIFFWVSFGGYILGTQRSNEIETVKETQRYEMLDYEAELEDAEILGKFWNKKGYYIVVYDKTIKAPELFKVEFSEWKRLDIGETY
ncbi:hypothetical protein [Streptococcus pseudopneumoniae]|uniref:hypothetical protein n=1 Tax=Streptococcus pseudopneumoniae TaxID=257758 RepID=UPI00021AFD67|nr:hypothetical protein [Streptococcus pseudopneumoniae]AEL10801.1 hypothetical protein SPPN_06855 [Streptococcus pseudopneumoniae IS7493]